MAKFEKFNQLPTDLKAQVIDKLLRPTDLKNVCLTNKQLHELAVKPLYRSVSLDLGHPSDTRLSAFLSPRNIGLQHVRQIRLYLARVQDPCNQDQMAHFATRMIIEMLPEDILEEFSWCPWRPFSQDNLLLLYQKQRKMKWLEVMDVDRDALPELKKKKRIQDNMFACAKKLALYPENRSTLNFCRFVVEKTAPVLDELIVHANFPAESEGRESLPGNSALIPTRELQDSATAPGVISSTIFGFMMPFDKCSSLPHLTSLRLHRISLRHCADTWCKIVNFTQMQQIRLYHCAGADSLFGQLSKSTHLPKKLKVLEIQHKDNEENEALIALDGFLCLVSGIRDLIIDMQGIKTLPAAAGIARHGKTLEMLSLHGSRDSVQVPPTIGGGQSDDPELVYELDEFDKICKACTSLEQLSCAWPQTSLLRPTNTEWLLFQIACFENMKQLVTLHITTWPSTKPCETKLTRSVYEQLLQGMATTLFASAREISRVISIPRPDEEGGNTDATEGEAEPDSSTSSSDTNTKTSTSTEKKQSPISKLRLIAFGISDKVYEREDSKHQAIYLRSTCKEALGQERVWAAPLSWCLRQFEEPRSEVLDFVLHREARMPCKDIDISSWPGIGVDDDVGWGDEV